MENEQVSSTNQTAVKSISIFVYNTHLFGGIFFAELGIEYHKDEKRRKEIVRRINASDYDVIGLCEVSILFVFASLMLARFGQMATRSTFASIALNDIRTTATNQKE